MAIIRGVSPRPALLRYPLVLPGAPKKHGQPRSALFSLLFTFSVQKTHTKKIKHITRVGFPQFGKFTTLYHISHIVRSGTIGTKLVIIVIVGSKFVIFKVKSRSCCVVRILFAWWLVFDDFAAFLIFHRWLPPESSILRQNLGVLKGLVRCQVSRLFRPFISRRAGDTRARDSTAGLIDVR